MSPFLLNRIRIKIVPLINKTKLNFSNKSDRSCFKCINYNVEDEMCYHIKKFPVLAKTERAEYQISNEYSCGPTGKYFTSGVIETQKKKSEPKPETNNDKFLHSIISSLEPKNTFEEEKRKLNLEEEKRNLGVLSKNTYVFGLSFFACNSLIYDLFPPYSWIITSVPLTLLFINSLLLIDHSFYYFYNKKENNKLGK